MSVLDGNPTEDQAPEVSEAKETDGTDQKVAEPEGTQEKGKEGVVDSEVSIPAWMAQNKGDLKTNEELAKHKTVDELSRAYLEMLKGNSSEPKAKAEEAEKPKYEFEKTLDADSDPFGEISNTMKSFLEESKVPPDVAEKLFDKVNEAYGASRKQLLEKGDKWCEKRLKETWGDEFDTKKKAVNRAYVALVKERPELAKGLDNTGASINPFVAEVFALIGQNLREDGSFASNQTGAAKRNPGGVPIDYSKPTK